MSAGAVSSLGAQARGDPVLSASHFTPLSVISHTPCFESGNSNLCLTIFILAQFAVFSQRVVFPDDKSSRSYLLSTAFIDRPTNLITSFAEPLPPSVVKDRSIGS